MKSDFHHKSIELLIRNNWVTKNLWFQNKNISLPTTDDWSDRYGMHRKFVSIANKKLNYQIIVMTILKYKKKGGGHFEQSIKGGFSWNFFFISRDIIVGALGSALLLDILLFCG